MQVVLFWLHGVFLEGVGSGGPHNKSKGEIHRRIWQPNLIVPSEYKPTQVDLLIVHWAMTDLSWSFHFVHDRNYTAYFLKYLQSVTPHYNSLLRPNGYHNLLNFAIATERNRPRTTYSEEIPACSLREGMNGLCCFTYAFGFYRQTNETFYYNYSVLYWL